MKPPFSWLPPSPPPVDFEGTFGVDIVGDIPPGLPTPKFPRLDKLSSLAEVEDYAGIALVASIISFIITHSIAKSLAGATEVRTTKILDGVER